MGFKKRAWNILKMSLIIIIPILVYNVGSTAILTENRNHPEPVQDCNSQGETSELEFSENGIKMYEENNRTTVTVPDNVETNLSFPKTSIDVLEINGLRFDDGTYTTIKNQNSRIVYSIEDSQMRSFDKVSVDSYTILPKTSGEVAYNIDMSRNVLDRLFYTGEQYNYKNSDVGCQKFEYFASGDYDINTYSKMLERTSGRIPFDRNYSNVKIIIVDEDLGKAETEVGGISYSNVIFIQEQKDTRRLFLHEYVHTRQDYGSFNSDMRRPWFMEGTAQYHSTRSMREAGYLNKYEYNFRIKLWLDQSDTTDINSVYLSDSRTINHYAYGPKIFHDYESELGEIRDYEGKEESVSEYYRNYDISGGNCSTYICKGISTVLGYINAFHRQPILYVATPAYVALLEGVFIISDWMKS